MLHGRLNLFGSAWETLRQHDEPSILIDIEHIFNADAEFFFRNVNTRLEGKDHAFIQRRRLTGIMHVQSNMMSQTVDKVLAQRLTVQVFSMRVDVVIGHFVERVTVRAAFQFRLPELKCLDGCFLGAKTML